MRDRLRKPWWEKRLRGPLVDFYTEDFIRVWLAFVGSDLDLVAEDSLGEMPEWYDRDVTELGWDSILGSLGCGGFDWAGDLRWQLEHGIAPGQPFLVHLERPHWYRCGEYGSEWDCEYDWELIRVAPLAPSAVVKRWEKALREEKSFREHRAKHLAELELLRRIDVKSMYLKCDVYFAPGQSTYDDMCMPNGIRYYLCSSASLPKERGGIAYLVSGESDEGDHDRAFRALLTNVTAKLPGLPEEKIRAMPRRSW